MSGFLSLTDLAAARGVSKQAISKQLQRLGDRVTTRKVGTRTLVDVAAFDAITGAETDPAQALRNRGSATGAGLPLTGGGAPQPVEKSVGARGQEDYSVARALREKHEAALSELVLNEKLGKLVPVRDVEDAMVTAAQKLLRVIESMTAKSNDPQVRAIVKSTQEELRAAIYREMKLVADEAAQEDGEEAA